MYIHNHICSFKHLRLNKPKKGRVRRRKTSSHVLQSEKLEQLPNIMVQAKGEKKNQNQNPVDNAKKEGEITRK
jgi:hypothetical protein